MSATGNPLGIPVKIVINIIPELLPLISVVGSFVYKLMLPGNRSRISIINANK